MKAQHDLTGSPFDLAQVIGGNSLVEQFEDFRLKINNGTLTGMMPYIVFTEIIASEILRHENVSNFVEQWHLIRPILQSLPQQHLYLLFSIAYTFSDDWEEILVSPAPMGADGSVYIPELADIVAKSDIPTELETLIPLALQQEISRTIGDQQTKTSLALSLVTFYDDMFMSVTRGTLQDPDERHDIATRFAEYENLNITAPNLRALYDAAIN